MKLTELIGILFNPEKLENLISVLGLDTQSEALKMNYSLKKMALKYLFSFG